MVAYSLDLRRRVLRAWDNEMTVDSIAATFDVSVAWIYRLVQRRRETGIDRAAETNQVSQPLTVARR